MTVAAYPFQWTDTYTVNIAVLDRQHQGLFDTINELNDAMALGQGNAATEAVLRKLLDYTHTHFATEEGLMSKHKFPGLMQHKAEHDLFGKNVVQFLKEYKEGKSGVPVALLMFLCHWLKEHILVTDKAYSGFLIARGVK